MSVLTKKIICVMMAVITILAFAGCGNNTENQPETTTAPATTQASAPVPEATTPATTVPAVTTTEPESTTLPETTTIPETTTLPETTTAKPDGSSIKNITDTLEGKTFYLAGKMDMHSGESIDVQMTCDGEDYRLVMDSRQMKISMIYLEGSPYIVNNSTNSYILFDETAMNSLDQVLGSFSALGVSISGSDMNEMKSMMSDFDQNMDFSQYIEQGEYFEYKTKKDEIEHLCSAYETEYGSIRIYTIDGELKYIDIYDADGLRQMSMKVSAFIPQTLTPITLTGLNQSPSILHLFGLVQ